MRKKRYGKGQNPWVLIVGVIVILSLLFTIMSKKGQNDIEVYTSADHVEKKQPDEDEQELDVDMSIYTDETYGFSISIPSDWNQITKDGFPTFVHSASASSIQIQTSEYDPAINNATADTVSTEIADKGMTFTNYTRVDNAHYEVLYQDFQNSTYDYIEEVFWDTDAVVKLVCTFDDKNYEKIQPYYDKIIGSFAWDRGDAEIPSGYYLYYNDAAQFEVGVPDTWVLGTAENAVVATDEATGAAMTVTVQENSGYLDGITANDMASLIRTGKDNFMMQDYNTSKEAASATASYVSGDVRVTSKWYIFANGKYMYFVSFDYEEGTIDGQIPEICAGMFREFVSEDTQENAATSETDTINPRDNSSVSDIQLPID